MIKQQQQQHPITPPPELVEQWADDMRNAQYFATQAARWGADQELESCCKWCADGSMVLAQELRAARRPKPPSLAEQALKALQDQIDTSFKLSSKSQERVDLIRAALERLQELENNG